MTEGTRYKENIRKEVRRSVRRQVSDVTGWKMMQNFCGVDNLGSNQTTFGKVHLLRSAMASFSKIGASKARGA